MASEKTISSAAVSFENFCTKTSASVISETFPDNSNTTVSLSTEQSLYPRKNLISPQRSKKWRSADSGSRSHVAIAIDLGASKVPGLLALVDSNLSKSSADNFVSAGVTENLTVRPNSASLSPTEILLQGAVSSDFSTAQDFKYSLYDQDSLNGVIRYYLDTDESGSAINSSGYRYWRLVVNKHSFADAYFQLGQLWLGQVTNIAPEIGGLSLKQADASPFSTAYNGARFSDKISPIRSIGIEIKHLPDSTEAIPLQNIAASSGATEEVILDISAWSSDVVRKASDTYYGRLESNGFQWSAQFQRRRTVKLSFVEAR